MRRLMGMGLVGVACFAGAPAAAFSLGEMSAASSVHGTLAGTGGSSAHGALDAVKRNLPAPTAVQSNLPDAGTASPPAATHGGGGGTSGWASSAGSGGSGKGWATAASGGSAGKGWLTADSGRGGGSGKGWATATAGGSAGKGWAAGGSGTSHAPRR